MSGRSTVRLDHQSGHRPIKGRLVVATHNPGKLTEMRGLLAPYRVEVVSAQELALAEPEEIGTTFSENARLKADAAARASGLPSFADDSGLEVAALGGAPGIYSARWAGPQRDFNLAMEKVERALRERGALTAADRRARFVSALCVAWPDRHVEAFAADVQGALVWPPRGAEGFGYDPMFLPDGYDRTFGEMTGEQKHGLPPHGTGLSHRARAFLALARACLGGPDPTPF